MISISRASFTAPLEGVYGRMIPIRCSSYQPIMMSVIRILLRSLCIKHSAVWESATAAPLSSRTENSCSVRSARDSAPDPQSVESADPAGPRDQPFPGAGAGDFGLSTLVAGEGACVKGCGGRARRGSGLGRAELRRRQT